MALWKDYCEARQTGELKDTEKVETMAAWTVTSRDFEMVGQKVFGKAVSLDLNMAAKKEYLRVSGMDSGKVA